MPRKKQNSTDLHSIELAAEISGMDILKPEQIKPTQSAWLNVYIYTIKGGSEK